MKNWQRYLVIILVAVVAGGAAYGYYQYQKAHSSSSDTAQVRIIVAGLGDNLVKVPLIAPSNVVDFAMDQYYAQYVRPDLLSAWKNDPMSAPGRLTSSPWPDSIEVTGITKRDTDTYVVNASIIEVAHGASGTTTETVSKDPVSFTLSRGPDGWQISGYEKR